MPAGALPIALLLPAGGPGDLRPGRAGARPDHASARRGRAPARRGHRRSRLRAARPRPLPQQRGRDRRRRADRRALPQDAHPRRPGLLREVLLHAGRPRVSRLRHRRGTDRGAHLLGPVVSGGSAPGGARRRRASSSIRRPSAGIRTRRRSTAPRSATPGGPSSAATRSPTASTSPRSTASASSSPKAAARASSSGAAPSSPTRRASSWPRPRPIARRSSSPRSTRCASRTCAATGPSCATGASTRTPGSPAASSTRTRVAARHKTLTAGRARRLPPAGGVGAPRGHVDRLAPQQERLAGQVRADPVGLRRDRAQDSRPGRSCAILVESKTHELAARADPRPHRMRPGARGVLSRADRPRWTRDSGPTFLRREGKRPEVAVCRFRFNGWAQLRRLEKRRRRAAEDRPKARPAPPRARLDGQARSSSRGAPST